MKWINDTGKASKIFETFLVLLLILMIGATGLMMLHVQEQLKENTAASVKTVFDKSANLINSDILSAQNAVYRYSRYINWEDQEKSVAMLGAFLKEYGCHQAFVLLWMICPFRILFSQRGNRAFLPSSWIRKGPASPPWVFPS